MRGKRKPKTKQENFLLWQELPQSRKAVTQAPPGPTVSWRPARRDEPLKSGWTVGLLWNSGWNWLARKKDAQAHELYQ